MTFKAKQIDVPIDDPHANDALNRAGAVGLVSNFIRNVNGPFVLALDSPWGTGKTTFVKMLNANLEKLGIPCLYFDAWRNDFAADPLAAFVGELESAFEDRSTARSKARKKFADARKVASFLAKKAVPIVGKVATVGVLDLGTLHEDAVAEFAEGALKDAVDAYSTEQSLINEFRKSLQGSIAELLSSMEADKIVILVDELDRCRPTYSVSLLERIKHLFDVENVVFVLSLDKEQLGNSLGAVYGERINSDEYLRRFIDLEFGLPKANPEAFTDHLFNTFKLEDQFSGRKFQEFPNEMGNIRETFKTLSEILNLSLRAREQCFTLIRVAVMVTPDKYFIYPHLLTTLAILKIGAKPVYKSFIQPDGRVAEVTDFLSDQPGGAELLNSHIGTIIKAFLLAAKHDRYSDRQDELKRVRLDVDNASLSEENRERAAKIAQIVDGLGLRDRMPPLDYVVAKLELAAEFER